MEDWLSLRTRLPGFVSNSIASKNTPAGSALFSEKRFTFLRPSRPRAFLATAAVAQFFPEGLEVWVFEGARFEAFAALHIERFHE